MIEEECEIESPLIRLQQLIQGLRVEFVVAEIEGGVDGLERLKVDIELLFLVVVRHDGACVDDQPVGRHLCSSTLVKRIPWPGVQALCSYYLRRTLRSCFGHMLEAWPPFYR